MSLEEFFIKFLSDLLNTSVTEIVAVVFGMVSVVLANRNSVWLYPTGIISTVISVYVMINAKLYAESALNMYYFIMSVYGWILWVKNRGKEGKSVISINGKTDWVITTAIVVLGWGILYFVLSRFTDSDVPMLDAIVSSAAWAGMWLLAKHKVQNWILLNISNAIAIPLLLYKGLAFYAILTLFLFIVAVFGYFRWLKLYRLQEEKSRA
ncbi:MAG: nicotinamide riboside transporter PnuC [Flavipsychrobacter sp.]